MTESNANNTIVKPTIFSGIQPSGAMTIGNYIGAINNWTKLQEDYNAYYCVVDLHAITVDQEPAALRCHTLEAIALLIACGIDPDKSTLYVQSQVSAHCELQWILSCITLFGAARRMTQFKDKSAKHPENINVGLLSYPVLMAADILLYNADLVPIGSDQKQHLELARDLAMRFNSKYSDTFKVPEGYIPPKDSGARIMSLQDPLHKMSKSDPDQNAFVLLTDSPDIIASKLRRAVTDSETRVAFDVKAKPGVSNLLSIHSAMSGESISDIVKMLDGKGYGDLKTSVADAIIARLMPVQAEYLRLLKDKAYLESVMKNGREKATRAAQRMLDKVKRKVGFVQLSRD